MFARLSAAVLLLSVSLPSLASPAEHLSFGYAARPEQATRTVELTLGDIYFQANDAKATSLEVKAGETVRFVLVNKGQLLHEFSLGDASMNAAHQKQMLKMQQSGMLTPTGMNHGDMATMDHAAMGHDTMKHDDPNSVLVEPGKTAELTWTFSKADNLEFACNLPGHYQAGMVGKMIVSH